MEIYNEYGRKSIDYVLLKKQFFFNKLLTLFFYLLVVLAFVLSSITVEEYSPFINYFNFFSSPKAFSSIQLQLELPEGINVVSYDFENEVFIISQNLYDGYNESLKDFYTEEQLAAGELYLFGFASKSEILIPPTYINVVSISGDYAIVVKPFFPSVTSSFEEMEMKIGLVKFRGKDVGDRTSFQVDYASLVDEMLSVQQMQFVNDSYIAIYNNQDDVDFTKNVVTFYDFKSYHKLLEVFKVRASLGYRFLFAENNLVAMSNSKAEFYRINQVDEEGFLVLNDTYMPFSEDRDEELIQYTTTTVSYLGNNWFMRQGFIKIPEDEISPQDLAFIEGRILLINSGDRTLGQEEKNYLLMRSDRYNSGTRINIKDSKLVPDLVVNKYNQSSTRVVSDYINNTMEESAADGKFAYYPPSMPIGALPRDGMSLVYYYYWFPEDLNPASYKISFCMMDSHANVYHPKENIYMPLLIVDGGAIQIGDPDYEIPPGNAVLIDKYNKEKLFKEISEDYAYVEVAYSNDILIVGEYNRNEGVNELFYGAFNKEGRQITHFKYLELSLFYGDCAIGMNKVGADYRYYRIDKDGEETILSDVLAIKNGIYITTDGYMTGLKCYDGTILLPNEYESIDVLETFLIDGMYQRTMVLAKKNNRTYIYSLG